VELADAATTLKDGAEQSTTTTTQMSESELESLCASYGGYMRAKRAATLIQQTYRQYSMSRSFAKLRLEAGESRRSQRFARRRGIATDCSPRQPQDSSVDVDRSLDLSQLCDANVEDNQQTGGTDAVEQPLDAAAAVAAADNADAVAILVLDTAAEKSSSDEFQGHDDFEDCDDGSGGGASSRSLSPTLPLPLLPAPGDLPSVYFESSLEDEMMSSCAGGRHKVCPGHSIQDCMFTVCPDAYPLDPRDRHGHSSYFEHRCYHHTGLSYGVCRSRSKHRTDQRNAGLSTTTTRYPDHTFRPSHVFQSPSSSFARFGLLSDHAEPSPIWKRKSRSVDSYDTGVGTGLEEWDVDMGRSGHTDRPWSELYPGSTTSSEDTGSIGSAGETTAVYQNRHQHATAANNTINQSVHSAMSSKRSSILITASSDLQRKRAYRIGLNLFNRLIA